VPIGAIRWPRQKAYFYVSPVRAFKDWTGRDAVGGSVFNVYRRLSRPPWHVSHSARQWRRLVYMGALSYLGGLVSSQDHACLTSQAPASSGTKLGPPPRIKGEECNGFLPLSHAEECGRECPLLVADDPLMAGQEFDRVQHAWLVLQGVQDWTKHAETKATFLLTVESGLLVYFVRLIGGDLFQGLSDIQILTAGLAAISGMGLLIYAIIMLVLVVYPRLREEDFTSEKWRNAIYFGHLTGQQPKAIENTLRRRDPLEQLARHLRAMSDIAWEKHLRLRKSITAAAVGFGLVMIAVAVLSNWR
jgi:hypothetical protein